MSMPYEHALRVLTQESKEADVLTYFNQRWFNNINIQFSDEVLMELNNFINKEKQEKDDEAERQKNEANDTL